VTHATHAPLARYSFAAAAPTQVLTATGCVVELMDASTGTIVREEGRALDVVRQITGASQRTAEQGMTLPPFVGGWAGYIGYEYGGVLERIPRAEDKPAGADKPSPQTEPRQATIPDVVLGRYAWVIAWDHATGQMWIVGDDDDAVQRAYDLLAMPPSLPSPETRDATPARHFFEDRRTDFDSSFSRAGYESAVQTVRRYIAAGDVFQVNLSQQFRARVAEEPWAFYQRLRTINPAPFSAYFDTGAATIVSISPERFLHLDRNGTIETRPIKGTRPRGSNPREDAMAQDALRASAKDAAEHVMIVDVLRNDIARVSTFGSVTVPELMTLESHPTVHHLVSTVRGTKRPETDAIDLLHACFPGGSITGAPKVRAMEIIAELEPVNRGVYCGAIGYLSASGAMDTSIAIRTCVFIPDAGQYHCTFSAGGGIVFDSVPAEEYDESLDKARAVMEAILACSGAGERPTSEDGQNSRLPDKAGPLAR
jgi:para-aminobenzoate synthetase component 1